MRSRPFIIIAILLVVLGGAAAAVYAFDSSKENTIAKGVRVGGVDLGGLTKAEAQAKLRRQILEPLRQPVVVHHDKKTWLLGAREARISTDIDTSVDRALAASRDGNAITRSWREVTGGTVDARFDPTVRYSDAAVVRMLDKIRRSLQRKPVDAKVSYSAGGISKVDSHTGRTVQASALHADIGRAIVSPTADRTFVARTKVVQPRVSTDQLADRYGTVLIINRGAFRLELFKRLKLKKTYGIAVGRVGLETPAGLYNIENKAVNPAWHVPNSAWAGSLAGQVIPGGAPNNPIKARWMGIYAGAGIHGTSEDGSIGTNASHGCIRMHIPDVEELYDEVPVGAPVYIA